MDWGYEVAVNDIVDNDEVADDRLEDEVAVNDIPKMEEERVGDDDEVTGIFMVLKHKISIMLREFVLKSIWLFKKLYIPGLRMSICQ